MKIALVGDVHANLPALEAVLADAKRRGAEAVPHLAEQNLGFRASPDASTASDSTLYEARDQQIAHLFRVLELRNLDHIPRPRPRAPSPPAGQCQ